MNKQDFYYDLPKELIAQDPLEDRASSRLMLLNKQNETIEHKTFHDIVDYLRAGDCLVINDTKVIPARLIGNRISDNGSGSIELLLLKHREDGTWESLAKPGKKARIGTKISFGDGLLVAIVKDVLPDGNRIIEFEYEGIFEEILDKLGQMPLPPYITHKLQDRNRYQTVYAKNDGSAAAPTAGLHFTPELLDEIAAKGITIARVTLHVGLGTFRPVKEDNILDHHMHTESYIILPEEAEKINKTKQNGGRVICVGTTSCRTLESAANDAGQLIPGSADTSIFIYPGYKFKIMDALITNFHLPESTLLMLVSAFSNKDFIMRAYKEAIDEKYRFFSFGDAMMLF